METPSPASPSHIVRPTEQFFGESVEGIEQDLVVYRPLEAVSDIEPDADTAAAQEAWTQPRSTYDVVALGLEALVAVCKKEDPELFSELADGLDQRDRDEHLAQILSLLQRRRDLIARSYDEIPDAWAAPTTQPEDPAVVIPMELGVQRPSPKIAQKVVRADRPATSAAEVTTLLPKIGDFENQ